MKNMDMFFRILAATFGTYFLASAITTLILVVLEVNPNIQEIVEAFKIEFLIGIAVILWVFYTKNIIKALIYIVVLTLVFFALNFYLLKGGVL
ncbi:hypothetical protein [Aliarcobacter cryaerophilus]|uniref:hypothetical protein n=1 Tax=Aliarcobacter cryaerophilus TaxID=28198 RepID=UPI0021B56083|nr:hypothetical protein [Aliarcobacter cryaerophilus]MCT7496256.1 hypothetical protein [Aliarcobacter cryaerophilus]